MQAILSKSLKQWEFTAAKRSFCWTLIADRSLAKNRGAVVAVNPSINDHSWGNDHYCSAPTGTPWGTPWFGTLTMPHPRRGAATYADTGIVIKRAFSFDLGGTSWGFFDVYGVDLSACPFDQQTWLHLWFFYIVAFRMMFVACLARCEAHPIDVASLRA